MSPTFRLPASKAYSTQQRPAASAKATSPHVGFYKSFGWPVAKVFLGAVFTYQVTYLLWVKLEQEEMKEQKREEIKSLQNELQKAKNAR